MKTHHRLITFSIIIVIGLLAINWLINNHQAIAPNIKFTDIDGKQHSLHDYLGKPTLVVFWATDCPGCIEEMPRLVKLHHDYFAQGFTIIAVAMSHDSLDHINAMRTARHLPYTITWDKDNKIAHAFDNVRVTPTHFLITPKGKITMRKIGDLNIDLLHKKLHNMGLSAA